MGIHTTAAVLLAGLGIAAAVARPAGADDAYPLRLEVGASVAICQTGTVMCPATVICDDLSIVTVGGDQRGAVLTGTKPGSTLCSAASASGAGMRRLYRVTVVAKKSPGS